MREGVHVERSRQPVGEVGPTQSECGFRELWSGAETSSIQATLKCTRFLDDAGFENPARGEVAEGRAPQLIEEEGSLPVSPGVAAASSLQCFSVSATTSGR